MPDAAREAREVAISERHARHAMSARTAGLKKVAKTDFKQDSERTARKFFSVIHEFAEECKEKRAEFAGKFLPGVARAVYDDWHADRFAKYKEKIDDLRGVFSRFCDVRGTSCEWNGFPSVDSKIRAKLDSDMAQLDGWSGDDVYGWIIDELDAGGDDPARLNHVRRTMKAQIVKLNYPNAGRLLQAIEDRLTVPEAIAAAEMADLKGEAVEEFDFWHRRVTKADDEGREALLRRARFKVGVGGDGVTDELRPANLLWRDQRTDDEGIPDPLLEKIDANAYAEAGGDEK